MVIKMKRVHIFEILNMIICVYLLLNTAYATGVKDETATFLEFEAGKSVFQLDGKPVSMDIQISVDNEQIFVPVHYVTDAFGYKLSENSAEQQYIISKDSQTITFSIGSKQVYVKAEDTNAEVKLETAPKRAGKYILMPVQFFKVCMPRAAGGGDKVPLGCGRAD